MTKRLQVLLPDEEMDEVRRAARRRRTSVASWVRQALRDARRAEAGLDAGQKLAAIREAVRHQYPTADIDQMNAEIERGYQG